MTRAANTITEAVFIDAPRDADVRALYEYWNGLRGDRTMPSRQDIDAAAIPKLLPYIIMYTVVADGGGYTVRLVGEEVVRFVGRNMTGHAAGSIMEPPAAELIIKILDAVATEREPKFRAGKAHWHPERAYSDFEACFLPLSSDGEAVDIILGGIKFPLS
jgi:hypothetical protein